MGETALSTKRSLVVEDGYLSAQAIADLGRDWGMEPVCPVGHLEEACRTARERALDCAILDVRLDQDLSFPVAAILSERAIPFVFVTAYPKQRLPPEFHAAPLLDKPFEPRALKQAIASLPPARCRLRQPDALAQRDLSNVVVTGSRR